MIETPVLRPGFAAPFPEGPLYPIVIPWIDGRRTAAEIAASLRSELAAEEVYFTLAMLEKQGLVVPADPEEALAGILSTLGFETTEAGIEILIVDDYLHPDLAELNRQALSAGTPWMLAKPRGRVAWIGPLFRPGATGCWEGLAHGLKENQFAPRPHEEGWPRPPTRTPA